jgi:hypothetical protein
MKVMTLMAAAALIAATHSIATRLASVRRAPERVAAERIFDLPAVRVYATLEPPTLESPDTPTVRPDYSIQLASRVFDLPALKVYAEPTHAAIQRPAKIRMALAVPRPTTRRGLQPTSAAREDARPYEQWLADCASAPVFDMPVRGCEPVRHVGRIRGGVLSASAGGHAFGQD